MAPADRPPKIFESTTYSVELGWSYCDDARRRIGAALNDEGHLAPEQIEAFLNEVTREARTYRGLGRSEHDRPTSGEVRSQLRELDKRMGSLRECLGGLSDEARAYLNNWGMELDGGPVTPALRDAERKLGEVHSTIGAAADTPAKKGRPSKVARRRFVLGLAKIWTDAHGGEWPKRRHDWNTARDYGPFHDFSRACIEPIDPNVAGLDDIIREVCGMGKIDPNLA